MAMILKRDPIWSLPLFSSVHSTHTLSPLPASNPSSTAVPTRAPTNNPFYERLRVSAEQHSQSPTMYVSEVSNCILSNGHSSNMTSAFTLSKAANMS